jgi:hypothetical protein
MKIHHLLLFSLIAIYMMACSKSETITEETTVVETPEYKALLLASGGTYFERKLPDNLKKTDWVYVAIAYPNGEKKAILVMSEMGVEFKSDTVKVYFFEGKHSDLPYVAMQVSEDTMGTGATKYAAKGTWKAKIEGKMRGEFSEPMIRFSTKNSISPIEGIEIPDSCFDLILYVDPNQPSS